jgi:hypothetical protein
MRFLTVRCFSTRAVTASCLATLLLLSDAKSQTQLPPQAPAALNAAAARVKSQVRQLPIGGRVTVQMLDGKEYYGNVHSIEPESFSVREVDLNQVLTFRYDEVRKVRQDYGRKNLYGRRVHPQRALIITLIVVGVLLTITFVALSKDKS